MAEVESVFVSRMLVEDSGVVVKSEGRSLSKPAGALERDFAWSDKKTEEMKVSKGFREIKRARKQEARQ